VTSCGLGGHRHVVAGGTCAACAAPVQASGPLPPVGDAPAWLAPPFLEPATSAACPAGGTHGPGHAVGTCTACAAGLDAVTDDTGLTWWLQEVTPAREPARAMA
jgi:hypothetical protein